MDPDEVVIITGTTEEGTETTVVEIITAHPDDQRSEEPTTVETESTVVEVVEAILEPLIGSHDETDNAAAGEYVVLTSDEQGVDEEEEVELEDAAAMAADNEATTYDGPAQGEASVPEGEATVDLGDGAYASQTVDTAGSSTEAPVEEPAAEATASDSSQSAADEEAAEAQAHDDAATEAQARADADVQTGDYEAASHERANAEDEAWEAGDSDMLHGRDSNELDLGATQQAQAEHYEQEEGQHAHEGDYAAARDDASNAANATEWGDYYAGGEDHTGQAKEEYRQEDNAVWEEQRANEQRHDAEWYAERGDLDQAAQSSEYAAEHQADADYHGELGEHDGEIGVHDSSSDVAHDTPVGDTDSSYDSSSHDSGSTDSYDSE